MQEWNGEGKWNKDLLPINRRQKTFIWMEKNAFLQFGLSALFTLSAQTEGRESL